MPLSPTDAAYIEANRATWNARTPFHVPSAFYDVDGFKRGRSTLKALEIAEVGDVRGKALLHLQCHFGLDTLSWARRGARVTGLDFSEASIDAARALAKEVAIDARFVCADVYDTRAAITQTFDVVFTSYGVLGWLPDLAPWARAVADSLAPGGTFHLVEFHPIVWMYDDALASVVYRYDDSGVIREELRGTYADRSAPLTGVTYGWNHGLATVFTALVRAGLVVDRLREIDASPYDVFPDMIEVAPPKELAGAGDGEAPHPWYRTRAFGDRAPLVFALRATKPRGQSDPR